MAGMSMIMPFLPLYIGDLGVKDPKALSVWSGVIMGSAFLVSALAAPFWGSLGDRKSRKLVILRASFGLSIVTILMSHCTNVYQLLGLRLLHGFLGGIVPTFIALVSVKLPKEKTGQAIGTLQTSLIAANIIGPFIGGFLTDLVGYRNVLFLISLLTVGGGVLTILFVKDSNSRSPAKKQTSVFENINAVFASKKVLAAGFVLMAVQFALGMMQPVMPLFIKQIYTGNNAATMIGASVAITGFATLLSAPFLGKLGDKKGHVNILSLSLLGTSIFYAPQALVVTLSQLFPLRFILGLFVGGVVPSTQTIIVKNTDNSNRGGILGITQAMSMLGFALGPIVGGSLGSVLGFRSVFLCTSAGLLLAWYLSGTLIKQQGPVGKEAVE